MDIRDAVNAVADYLLKETGTRMCPSDEALMMLLQDWIGQCRNMVILNAEVEFWRRRAMAGDYLELELAETLVSVTMQ